MTKENANLESDFCEKIQKLILSSQDTIWVHTHEETRAFKEILRAVELLRIRPKYTDSFDMDFGVWTLTSGIQAWSCPKTNDVVNERDQPAHLNPNPLETKQPDKAIGWLARHPKDIVVVFKDLHQTLTKAEPVRSLRDFIAGLQNPQSDAPPTKVVIVLSPVISIPIELEKEFVVVDFELPGPKIIENRLNEILDNVERAKTNKNCRPGTKQIIKTITEQKENIVNLARGLTMQEFDDALSLILIEKNDPLETIRAQKKQIVLKNGCLEYMDPIPMGDVGGLDRLKSWMDERQAGWTKEGQAYGLRPPKGALLLGVQGCGKTMVGRAVAQAWKLPLYKLDIGRLFNSTIGSSESATRNVLKTIESVAPAVLLIDEIDKGLSGVKSSSISDGGTTARVVGTILTWMNDRKNDIFIVATCNDVESLPPELLRKGRFDEIFFVDLPGIEAREQIFTIHIRKLDRNTEDFDVKRFAASTPHFSGAEIEAIVYSALVKSFPDGELRNKHVMQAIHQTVPLWTTRHEAIQKLITWVGRNEEKQDGVRALFASSETFGLSTDDKNIVPMKLDN